MKILQLCKKFPFPAKDGESIAILQMSKALTINGCEVSLLAMNTLKHFVDLEDGYPNELSYYKSIHSVSVDNRIKWFQAFKNIFSSDSYHISRFFSNEFSEKLEELLKNEEFDVIQLETLYLAPFLSIIKKYSKALIVLRAHNIEHEIWQRIATQVRSLPKKFYLRYLSQKLKNFEVSTLNDYDFLVAITERDLVHFKSLGYKNGCVSSPVGFEVNRFKENYDAFYKPLKLSFIGSLDWMPNSEAIRWFLKDVWPILHQKFPLLEFHFAGRNPPPDLLQVKLDSVYFHNDIVDSEKFLLEFPVLVVPLFAGSGIRVKILEAMALGRVVITTSIGLEGIPAKHKEHVFIANNIQDFVDSVGMCHDKYLKLQSIGENARAFVQSQFDSSKLAIKLVNAYKKALHSHSYTS